LAFPVNVVVPQPIAPRGLDVPPRIVLLLMDYYPPAYRAGGPTRSVPAMVDRFGDQTRFLVVTRDHDLGTAEPFPGVSSKRWNARGRALCLYMSELRASMGGPGWAVRHTTHDVLYLNSIFSIAFTFWPLLGRRAHLLPHRGLVIAPRGELDSGALAIKTRRKALYLTVARRLGLLRDAVWHAESQQEAVRIANLFGAAAHVVHAPAIPASIAPPSTVSPKAPGELSLVSIGRIARKKNLRFAIEALKKVVGRATFDIYGPIEDRRYWRDCQQAMSELPPSVSIAYRGLLEPDQVPAALANYHLFFAPTLAENYGHAIVEALLAACPVLISDQTPWHNLQDRRAGWDLALRDIDRFCQALQFCIEMDQEQLAEWQAGARRVGQEIASNPVIDSAYHELFSATARAVQGP
jgi:glycosyltransferase involved in cell wall biosynthesis